MGLRDLFKKAKPVIKSLAEVELPCLLVERHPVKPWPLVVVVNDLVNKVLVESLAPEEYISEVARTLLLHTLSTKDAFNTVSFSGIEVSVSYEGAVNVYYYSGDFIKSSEDTETLAQEYLDVVYEDYVKYVDGRWGEVKSRVVSGDIAFVRTLVNPVTSLTVLGKVKVGHTPLTFRNVNGSVDHLDFFVVKDKQQAWMLGNLGISIYLDTIVLQLLSTASLLRHRGDVIRAHVTELDCLISVNVVTGSLGGSKKYTATAKTLELLEKVKNKGLFDRGRTTGVFKRLSSGQ